VKGARDRRELIADRLHRRSREQLSRRAERMSGQAQASWNVGDSDVSFRRCARQRRRGESLIGPPDLPSFSRLRRYATFENDNAAGIHLMDPWLDSTNQSAVLEWLKSSFLAHCEEFSSPPILPPAPYSPALACPFSDNGNRQPFGLYTHPIHLAVGYPGLADPIATREMIQGFLDWVQTFSNVWFVTNQQVSLPSFAAIAGAELKSVFAPAACSSWNG
jgi:hypothetical protein